MIRHILPACPDCALYAPPRGGMSQRRPLLFTDQPCKRCNGVGVLLDVRMPVLDRQIVDAWRDEPQWHREARARAEAAGVPGFFQPRHPAPTLADKLRALAPRPEWFGPPLTPDPVEGRSPGP